jgi:hypothetical protein
MSAVSRTVLSRIFLVAVGGAVVVACSASPDSEPTAESTGEALSVRPTCAANQVAVSSEDPGPNGRPIVSWECVQAPASDFTTKPEGDAGVDTCGSATVPTPASLSTCSLGILIDSQPVFACPLSTVVPTSLGLVPASNGLCERSDSNQDSVPGTCEEVVTVSSLGSSCLGSAIAGWKLVIDVAGEFVLPSPPPPPCTPKGCQGGGCGGPCAVSIPAPAMR